MSQIKKEKPPKKEEGGDQIKESPSNKSNNTEPLKPEDGKVIELYDPSLYFLKD